ncbi:PHP domain-containing protein [Anaerofustis sp.]|uniref:PHP domain-containing protein n=1 Tax=Anaerofustis sp. TaxID=1872517 RepID=UPI0025C5B783|nr:PHP domain-containing protein [Anaerofustis sp.]
MKIDLHIHSNASADGEVSIENIIDMSISKGLKYIAAADHESIANVKNGLDYSKNKDITFIPATEIFVYHKGKLLHMLGYGIDINNKELNEEIEKIWTGRKEGIKKQIDLIRSKGLKIKEDDVFSYATGDIPLLSAYIHAILINDENRNHRLVHGLENNIENIITLSREAFGVGKELYAPTYMPDSKHLIKIINNAGGVAVIAHPGVDIKKDLHILDELKEYGIKGIEAYYTSHTKKQTDTYKNYAIKNNLFYTCGSDFHGSFKPKNELGCVQTDNNEQAINNIYKYSKNLQQI